MPTLLTLPGDGIGPEVMAATRRVIDFFNARGASSFVVEEALVGGAAVDATGSPLPEETLAKADAADAILLACVGGPQYDALPYDVRPRPACLACASATSCSPTCARRSATRRSPTPPR